MNLMSVTFASLSFDKFSCFLTILQSLLFDVSLAFYLKESDDNFGRGSEEYLSLASLLGIVDVF